MKNGEYVLQTAKPEKVDKETKEVIEAIPGVSINEDMLKKFENKLNLEDQLKQFISY
jgi:hypothetical protein